jgi:hypothetical protein
VETGSLRHVIAAAAAALLAVVISILLSIYGSHGLQGGLAVTLGYPGGFVNWRLNPGRVSYGLITCVNWLIYFGFFEAMLAAKRRL